MRKIFILGGSSLQLDLILEAKKMFFYTIVLDMDKNCIGSKWCDEFLHIDISNKELVFEKAKDYNIEAILTSATEVGNTTACFVGEKLGLNTNSYQTALNTTNKILMKEILIKNNLPTAMHQILNNNTLTTWDKFPCIVKPSDSSGGRGVYYCKNNDELEINKKISLTFSKSDSLIIEEYIKGEQFSIETITVNNHHSIIAITKEYINDIPNIVETHQTIPATINELLKQEIQNLIFSTLDKFNISFGASHIEIRVDENKNIYIVELASRIGGWRTEMINLAFGISYSQLLILSALKINIHIQPIANNIVTVKLILNNKDLEEYKKLKSINPEKVYEPKSIQVNKIDKFQANNLLESKGYYFILEASV